MTLTLRDMQRFNLQDRGKKPPLKIDVNRTPAGMADEGFNSPATNNFNSDVEQRGYLSPRVMRSACDFCHTKRIKCKREEQDSPGFPCEQCKRRGIECKFSYKEKTGPKPRCLAPKEGRFGRHTSASPLHFRSNGSHIVERSNAVNSSLAHSQYSSLSSSYNSSPMGTGRIAVQEQMSNSGKQIEREKMFLNTYINTVAQVLPFSQNHVLLEAMREREIGPIHAIASSVPQAQLAGALAIGALIHNERAAELYHCAARDHLKNLFSAPNPEAASVLCMLAFYWQYRNDDEKKIVYVKHAKVGLEQRACEPSLELHICMEYLDFDNAGHFRSDSCNLPNLLRVIHVVSCMLGNIQVLMDPTFGFAQAKMYGHELGECSATLKPNRGEDVPAILCIGLYSFLLVMLGRRPEAVSALLRIPAFLESCPDAPRALPLSWDTCLMAALLSFLLQLNPQYNVIHAAVERAQNATAATQWTCRLPPPGSSLDKFLQHRCPSTSNICSIICQLWNQTEHGSRCFYRDHSESIPRHPNSAMNRSGLPSPQNVKYREQLVTSADTQQPFHENHSPYSYSRPPRPHREISGASEHDDISPEVRLHLLNSNQASPVPYTPKRIRNSRTSSPSGSHSPTVEQTWNESDDNRGGSIKEEISSIYSISPHYTSSPYNNSRNRLPQRNKQHLARGEIFSRSSSGGIEKSHTSSPMTREVVETANTAALMQQMQDLSHGLDVGKLDLPGFGTIPSGLNSSHGSRKVETPRGHHRRVSNALAELLATNSENQGNGGIFNQNGGNGLLMGLALNESAGKDLASNNYLHAHQDSNCSEGLLALLDDSDLMGVLNDWGAGADQMYPSLEGDNDQSLIQGK
mmetsp:Transcript_7631/g.11452  ORF Transcript_7631/g.11452 Transcript_7631/m.11452 type:complete len:859 (-) Transcript_7631:223-2799(-)